MKHFLFILGLLFGKNKGVRDEADFLGFEAFTRPTEANNGPTISSPDATPLIQKTA